MTFVAARAQMHHKIMQHSWLDNDPIQNTCVCCVLCFRVYLGAGLVNSSVFSECAGVNANPVVRMGPCEVAPCTLVFLKLLQVLVLSVSLVSQVFPVSVYSVCICRSRFSGFGLSSSVRPFPVRFTAVL